MFTLEDLERAHRLVGGVLPPTPQRRWPLLAERLGADVVVKHENHQVTGAFKVRGGLVYVDRMKRERSHVDRAGLGDARQSRAVDRLCRAPPWRAGDHLRAARQFGGEEPGDAGLRRRGDRGRQRLRCGQGRGEELRRRQRPRDGAVVPSRPGAGRGHLCAGADDRRAGARRALCAGRAGVGHLRLHSGARPAWPQDRDRRRPGARGAGLCAVA